MATHDYYRIARGLKTPTLANADLGGRRDYSNTKLSSKTSNVLIKTNQSLPIGKDCKGLSRVNI